MTNRQTSYGASGATPNNDIFAELLDDAPHSSERHAQTITPFSNVYLCSDDHVVYWEPGLQDVAIDQHHAVTLSSNENDVTLTVYPFEQNNAGKKEIGSKFLQRISLPKDVCNHSNNNVATLLYVVSCVQPSSIFPCARLDQLLFSLLFDSQSGCHPPVILIGLESGLVGYMHIGVKNQNPRNPKLETLYHLEQPVLSMFSVCLKHPSPKRANQDTMLIGDALCIFGTLGKLVLITQDNSKVLQDRTVIREYYVPGPIVCAAVNDNLSTLFYSTLNEIFILPLECKTKSKNETERTPVLILPFSLSPISLNIPKVLALSPEESGSLICLKSDGRVLLVPQSFAETQSSSSSSGSQIKKHLSEIQEKASQATNIRDEIRQLDEVIKHLNIVTQLLYEILRNQESENKTTFQESGISFNISVDYEEQGTSLNPRVILRCELMNSTKFSFSPNWSLVVQVTTSEPWFNEESSVQATMNHSVSLTSASTHHISIPLEGVLSYLTPIEVSCYVVFGFKELLPGFFKVSDAALCEEGFSVLVSKTQLNILNFLRKQETCLSVNKQHRYPTQLLQNTLKSINTSWLANDVSQPAQEYFTFSIKLSKEAVCFIQTQVHDILLSDNKSDASLTQKTKSNQVEVKDDNFPSQEACVLYFILQASCRHIRHDNIKSLGNHLVARTPNEEVVKFQVADQLGTKQGIEGVEVRIYTSSRELGCAVHSSLLTLLKVGLNSSCTYRDRLEELEHLKK